MYMYVHMYLSKTWKLFIIENIILHTCIGQLSLLGRYYKGSFLGRQSDRQTDKVLIPALEISDDCQQAHRVGISYHTEFVHTEPGGESHTRLRRKYPLPCKKKLSFTFQNESTIENVIFICQNQYRFKVNKQIDKDFMFIPLRERVYM